GNERLRIAERELPVIVRQGRGLIEQRIGQGRGLVPELRIGKDVRIEDGRVLANAGDDAAARAQSGASAHSIPVGAYSRGADTGGSRSHRGVYRTQQTAPFGAPQDLAREERAVTLNRDIEIVLEL